MEKFYLYDNVYISSIRNTFLIPGKVKKYKRNPLFSEGFFEDREWEVRYDNGYPQVFYDEEYQIYRLYYTSFIKDPCSATHSLEERKFKTYKPSSQRVTALLYAYSADGVNWIKPNLGLVEFEGSKENNIIMERAHGASVFKDFNEKDSAKRYKMIMKHDGMDKMAVSFSTDGIDWCEPISWIQYNPAGDTHNYAFYDEKFKKYVLITRTWDGIRVVARSESDDFINWTEPVEIYRGVGFEDQIYSMPVFKQQDNYIGLASIYHDGDKSDLLYDHVHSELTMSHDGINWERVGKGREFIPRGAGRYPNGECDCGCIYVSPPVEKDNSYIFYYMGGNGQHTNYRETSLCMCSIDKDRLAGYSSRGNDYGYLMTKNFHIVGNAINLTVDVFPGGSVDVEICRPRKNLFDEGEAVKVGSYQKVINSIGEAEGGFDFNCFNTITESGTIELSYRGSNLGELIGQDDGVFFKFRIKNAVVYTISGDLHTFVKK